MSDKSHTTLSQEFQSPDGRSLARGATGATTLAALIALLPESLFRTIALVLVPAVTAGARFMWGSYGFLVSDWMEDKVDGIFLGRIEKSALRIKVKTTAILDDPTSTPGPSE